MRTRGRPSGAAGRAPRTGRAAPSRERRSRAALPTRVVPAAQARARRATLTARAAILAVALASVALALALPFKIWVAQRGQIHALEAQTRAQHARVAQLQHQQQLWADPAYVEQQARERLHFVMPGETAYVVLGQPPPRAHTTTKPVAAGSTRGPWYSRLWQTVEAAGADHSTGR